MVIKETLKFCVTNLCMLWFIPLNRYNCVAVIARVTIRPTFGGTIPLFEALSRFFDRKSRFLPLCNRTNFTKIMDTSIISLTKAGR